MRSTRFFFSTVKYDAGPEPEPETWELVISLGDNTYTVVSPETSPVNGRHWNQTLKVPGNETGIYLEDMVDISGNTLSGVDLRFIVAPDIAATDGPASTGIFPANATRGSYPSPSSGAEMRCAIDLPAGTYKVFLFTASQTTQQRTNLTVRPNGGSATSEGTVVGNTGLGNSAPEYEFSNGGSGIVLASPGYIEIGYSRNTSGGANHGRLNVIRLQKIG